MGIPFFPISPGKFLPTELVKRSMMDCSGILALM